MSAASGTPPPLPRRLPSVPRVSLGAPAMALLAVAAVIFLPAWIWFWWRIEPGAGEIAVLIRKTGDDLPSGQILALAPGQKGIQRDVLGEGRYFRNPYTWDWTIRDLTVIPAGKVGVLTRLYGKDLPVGTFTAPDDDTKGILPEVLTPGNYRLNPFAYRVEQFDAITIRAGSVGVRTSLVGRDPIQSDIPEAQANTFLVEDGFKGTMPHVLSPGTYYLNPYLYSVVEVTLQSQRFEMSGDDAITFLTQDGFTVTVEGTIEFAIQGEQAALLTHRVGEMDDVIQKIILPPARGFSRLEGSKNFATNYIAGESRQTFQNNLESHLAQRCEKWGVSIRSVLIRNIKVPEEIASIIRDREVAVQNANKFGQQLEQAKSKAELTRQEMLAEQNKAKVEADTAKIRAVIGAQQEVAVKVVKAEQEREVAKLEKAAAEFQAQATVLKAEADRDVVRLNNEAQAQVFAAQVQAFGSGLAFARHAFYQKLGPRIQSVLSSDGPEGLGALFRPFLPGKEVAP